MLDLKDAIIILIKGLDLVLNNSSPAETETHTHAHTYARVCSCYCRYLHVQRGELRDHKCTMAQVKTPGEMR